MRAKLRRRPLVALGQRSALPPRGGSRASSLRAWLVALAVGLLLGSCQGRGCSACGSSKDGKAGLQVGSAGKEVIEQVPDSDVELLSLGREPRVALSVRRWEGLRYRTRSSVTSTSGAEGQPAVEGPTVSMSLLSEVVRGSADPVVVQQDGRTRHLIEELAVLEDASAQHAAAPPDALAAYNTSLRSFRGTRLRQWVDANGEVVQQRVDSWGAVKPPPDVEQSARNTIEQQQHFPFRLPPAPVGVGASWRFRETIVLSGASVVQVADMTLEAVSKDTATVRMQVRQQAPHQTIPHPLDPHATATLETYRGDGDGRVTMDRLTGVPLSGRLATTARLRISGQVGGVHQAVTLFAGGVLTTTTRLLADGEDAGLAALPSGAPAREAGLDEDPSAEEMP